MAVIDGIGNGLDQAFFMFWETLWALVLGFALSGAVQAFVSRTEMQRTLGDHRLKTLVKAGFFGVISSSCSYAASALAKALFSRGADFTAAMVFMVASTNLVVELGIVLWLLIGFQFALAEFVGGAIMIALLGLVLPRVIPPSWAEAARARLDPGAEPEAGDAPPPWRRRLRSGSRWANAAGFTVGDLRMLRRELVVGFGIAGFLAAVVPESFWRSLFFTGHGFGSSLENVILGPLLAIISFVCSIGNVPLAAALWRGGISFGGVVSFVFADLITLPLLSIYRRYYGVGLTLRLLGAFWAAMSVGGLATEYLFKALSLASPARPRVVVRTGFALDYTTVLNVVAIIAFAWIYRAYRHRDDSDAAVGFAEDAVCGMRVEIAQAPARVRHEGITLYFCSDHCGRRFSDAPGHYGAGKQTVDVASGARGTSGEMAAR